MSEDSSSGSEYLSSDEELQAEFSKGLLQPGIIVRKAPVKKCTNDVACMKEQLAKLKRKELKWLERMDITETVGTAESSEQAEKNLGGERADMDAEDDFKREMHFFRQAQSSVLIGLRKLEELGVPLQRPDDYFAEMIKTDDHMKKVRQSLLSRQKILEQKEKARKMRELKKYGKKIQQEILQKRRTEKKAVLDSVNKLKRGKGDRPSFMKRDDEEGSFSVTTARIGTPGLKEGGVSWKKRGLVDKSQKRKLKDHKFGFGGKKKWLKSNTAESSADMSSFRTEKHGQKAVRRDGNKWDKAGGKRDRGPGGKSGDSRGKRDRGPGGKSGSKKNNKPVRLGKSRRQKMKL